jgi:hypothetical protein
MLCCVYVDILGSYYMNGMLCKRLQQHSAHCSSVLEYNIPLVQQNIQQPQVREAQRQRETLITAAVEHEY